MVLCLLSLVVSVVTGTDFTTQYEHLLKSGCAPLFYWLDLIIAVIIPVVFYTAYTRGTVSTFEWQLFVLGCFVGLTWEIGFFSQGPVFNNDPLYVLHSPFPVHPMLQPFAHALWDGAIFWIGVRLVFLICGAASFTVFRLKELAVLLTWGISSALIVEVGASSSGWAYVPRWWNPVILVPDITLLPLLVWIIAPVAFYLLALRVHQHLQHLHVAEQIKTA